MLSEYMGYIMLISFWLIKTGVNTQFLKKYKYYTV